MPLPDHEGEDLTPKPGLAHPLPEHPRDAVFQYVPVDPPGLLHDRKFVSALLRPDLRRLGIERRRLPEGEVFPEAFEQREGHRLRINVDCPGACAHPGGCVTETLHRPDIGEERLVKRPLKAPAYPEHGFIVAGDQEDPVLHRPGEVELVCPPKDRGKLPWGVLRVHAEPEALHAVPEFGGRSLSLHTHEWAALVFIMPERQPCRRAGLCGHTTYYR